MLPGDEFKVQREALMLLSGNDSCKVMSIVMFDDMSVPRAFREVLEESGEVTAHQLVERAGRKVGFDLMKCFTEMFHGG